MSSSFSCFIFGSFSFSNKKILASTSPLQRTDLSLDENSNTSASSSIVTVSRVKKRPSHLQLTGNLNNNQQQQSWLIPASKGPCLQTDIDADETATSSSTTTICSTTVDRTGSCSPLSLPRPSPIASDFELSVLERFDQLLASLGTSSGWSLCLSWFLFQIFFLH